MFISMSLLAIAAFVWWGVLWLCLPVSWLGMRPSAVLLLHGVPPVLIFSLIKLWLGHLKTDRKAQSEQQEALKKKQDEAQLEAKRAAHNQALAERQRAVDCRWLGVASSQPLPAAWRECTVGYWQAPATAAEAKRAQADQQTTGEPEKSVADDATDQPAADAEPLTPLEPEQLQAAAYEACRQLLGQLYQTQRGAAWLPVLLVPGAGPKAEQLKALQAMLPELWQTQYGDTPDAVPTRPVVRFLSGHGSLAERIQQFWQQAPEVPGMLLLSISTTEQPAGAWLVSGLVVMQHGLGQSNTGEPQRADGDVYQTFWERELAEGRRDPRWGSVPGWAQFELAAMPPVAVLHQGTQLTDLPKGSMALSQRVSALLRQALVQGRVCDEPFVAEGAAASEPPAPDPAAIAWLVLNGAGAASLQSRYSVALGQALTSNGLELDVFQQASHGGQGRAVFDPAAEQFLLTTASLALASQHQQPVLLGYFSQQAINFAVSRSPEALPT